MAPDGVEGQGRRVLFCVHNLSIGNQSQFDKSLEAVADTGDQTAALVKKRHDTIRRLGVPEKGGNELAGAVRLVSAGKSARDKEHLGAVKSL